jgi:hypothetical protein
MVNNTLTDKDKKSGKEEAEELREILSAVQETVPQLISSLVQSIYSPEVAKAIADSVGTMYQNLKKQGLPDSLALSMTENYMNLLDIKELVGKGIKAGEHPDIEVEVRKKLAEKEKE